MRGTRRPLILPGQLARGGAKPPSMATSALRCGGIGLVGARGLVSIDRAMKIDPRLVQARRVHDELARPAQVAPQPDATRRAVGR